MQGFIQIKLPAWKRAVFTRSFALIPSLIVAIAFGHHATLFDKVNEWLNVLQSIQLPFAVIPVVQMTSWEYIMGKNATPLPYRVMQKMTIDFSFFPTETEHERRKKKGFNIVIYSCFEILHFSLQILNWLLFVIILSTNIFLVVTSIKFTALSIAIATIAMLLYLSFIFCKLNSLCFSFLLCLPDFVLYSVFETVA